MSFIDSALKASATACLAAVTVTLGVTVVGSVIYGPRIARSVIDASNGVARVSNLAGNVMISTDKSIRTINANLSEVCEKLYISMESTADTLEILAAKIKDPNDKNKEEIHQLMSSIVKTVNTIEKKADELNVEGINESVNVIKSVVTQLNNGLNDIFIECDKGKRLNIATVSGMISFLRDSFRVTNSTANTPRATTPCASGNTPRSREKSPITVVNSDCNKPLQ